MTKENKEIPIPQIPLQFFNTETRSKELFKTFVEGQVKMYTCGPTIYNYAHIGNFRTYVVEDLIRRTLKFFGYQVNQVMNITDVDDKTIRLATEKKLPLVEATRPFMNAFFVDIQTLGIEKVENYPLATDYIPQMIDFIQKLLEKGIAYRSKDQSIYFSIDQFPRYGCLCHLKLEELKPGAGENNCAADEYDKENVSDFVLWKAYEPCRDGEIYWESPFGAGRPGWHLECSTMAMTLLGESIDLHMGGVDNIFPHHENEIAQSEAYSGKPFVKQWIHVEHLLVNNRKMSKSSGNFFTLRDLLDKGFKGPEVRYMLMHTHYATQLNFTLEGLEGARTSLVRLNDFAKRMYELADPAVDFSTKGEACLEKAMRAFSEAIANDLNISIALSSLFDMMHEINILYDAGTLTKGDAAGVIGLLRQFNRVLGVMTLDFEEEALPQELQDLLKKREEARKSKDFATADSCRKEIDLRGYRIEDTPHGPRLKKK
jgi:cysteinyl-tRNA synthetase